MADFGLQRVFKLKFFDILTDELKIELTKLQETSFENSQEVTYLTNGNMVKVASFDFGKAARISGANTQISEGLMEIQSGSDAVTLTNTNEIQFSETLILATDIASTTNSAVGTLNNEIQFAYVLDVNGAVIATLTQAVAASATEFSYVTGTKVATFDTGTYPDGTKVRVHYYPTTSTATQISNFSNTFSGTYRMVADVLLKSVCDDQIANGQIVAGKAHIEGAYTWTASEGGSPTLHDFAVEMLETCADEKLWDFFTFKTSNMS
jgi:hypothetical protein